MSGRAGVRSDRLRSCWRSYGYLVLALVGLCAATVPERACGQEVVHVSGDVTCAGCRIELDTVATIGGLDGPGLRVVEALSKFAVDRRGRILISSWTYPEVSVFDASGRFIRTFGGRGEGPGEYGSGVSNINVGPRYVHIFESGEGRTLLDYNFEFVRKDRLPLHVPSSFVLESDEVVLAGSVATSVAVGHRFHLLSPSGEITSHWEGHNVVPDGMVASHDLFNVTVGDGSLWFVALRSNRIYRWSLTPEPTFVRTFERQVNEFDRHLGSWPPPTNFGAFVDESGLWVVWNTPDPDRPSAESEMPDVPMGQLYDGWIDLVDMDSGNTLARRGVDGILPGIAAGSKYVVAFDETDAGVPYIHLLAPRLVGGAG